MMEYRNLGRLGLKLLVLSFGSGTFGGQGRLFSASGTSDVDDDQCETKTERPACRCRKTLGRIGV
jgi:aryl-alcohol dehydrogenase-like predicted oxidoreductase